MQKHKKTNCGKIFIFCGPSGVGKGSIIKEIIKKHKNISIVPTITTRSPKPRDKQTSHYIYTNKKDFLQKIKNDLFFEYNFYNNNYYGTFKKDLKNIVINNKIAIMEQDVENAIITKKYFPKNIITIFICSPIQTIRQRLFSRGENSKKEISERIKLAKIELDKKNRCDFKIENIQNNLSIAVDKCINIIKKETYEKS